MDSSSQTPCSVCSWTAEKQKCCNYVSQVKLFYGAGDRGVWAIGSHLILKEQPNDSPKTEYETLSIKFLKEHTTIPVPTIVKNWVDNGRNYTLTERIKGQTLEAAWPTLSTEDKNRIADETAEYLLQLRKFQSSRMGRNG